MKTLFFFIFVIVFAICKLIIPGYFDSSQTVLPTANTEFIDDVTGGILHPVNSTQTLPTATEPAVTETPSIVSNDPKALFGEPKQEETFDRGSSGFGLNAGLNDDEAIRIVAIDNKLTVAPKKNNGWITWRLRPPVVQDTAVEMDFSITTCARGDRVGILMHAPDYTEGHGYYISLACEGTLSIMRDTSLLGSASAAQAFKNSSGDVNTITALYRGGMITAFLNGEEILGVEDKTYAEGYSGFFTAPQGQDTLRLDILSFKEYY